MSEINNSNDYLDLRPLYASHYGNSRIFTAKNNGRKVIVKALKADRSDDSRCQALLRQEYEMTAPLDNKFVRKAIDFVNIEGLGDCIVFEYVEGKPLAEHVRVGTLTEKQVKGVLVDICDGLAYLHRNLVTHGNLNLENVMVTADGNRAKLIDIGIPETDPTADRELLIKEMEFVAPEIIKGEDFDPRADIYSLGKIIEFINERNISRQYGSVSTHCTQFSKEQRYDNIAEVRSGITKGHPVMKVGILLLVLAVLAVLAIIYVPKIKVGVEKERTERMAVDFAREVDNMRQELPDLCQKYRLNSISEPLVIDWTADSLRLAQNLTPFFVSEQYKAMAEAALNEQRTAIMDSRRRDFNSLVVEEFKNASDSLAVAMKAAQPNMTDAELLNEAGKWFEQTK